MNVQIKKGLLEYCVLAQLYRGESYGYQLMKDISTCIDISESTLYPILKRLESEKYVETYKVEHNNRLRCYFRLTKNGELHLQDFMKERTEIIRVLDFITERKETKKDE